jgi:hypothetical protein
MHNRFICGILVCLRGEGEVGIQLRTRMFGLASLFYDGIRPLGGG